MSVRGNVGAVARRGVCLSLPMSVCVMVCVYRARGLDAVYAWCTCVCVYVCVLCAL